MVIRGDLRSRGIGRVFLRGRIQGTFTEGMKQSERKGEQSFPNETHDRPTEAYAYK